MAESVRSLSRTPIIQPANGDSSPQTRRLQPSRSLDLDARLCGDPRSKKARSLPENATWLCLDGSQFAASLFVGRHAIQVFAGAKEDLTVADRRRCAEIFGVGCQSIRCKFLKRVGTFDDMNVAAACHIIDLAIAQHWRGIIAASTAAESATTTSSAALMHFAVPAEIM